MALFDEFDEVDAAVYARESAMVDSAELIAEALEASGMSRAELARALGVSRSEITARLRGHRNITVRSLAETLHVLGSRLDLATSRRVEAGTDTATLAFMAHYRAANTLEHENHEQAAFRMAFTR